MGSPSRNLLKYYRLLGVKVGASERELRQAFLKQALKCHPDQPTGCPKQFRELHEAYQTLKGSHSDVADNARNQRYQSRGIFYSGHDKGVEKVVTLMMFSAACGVFSFFVAATKASGSR
uniref:J domain-containing protein n=1 Tax=Rhodosorus marinus TaxID=101924 RepID=A0A7S3A8M4_9RHOD|mmetsp:Transcript_7296/g.32352  ORF Transcript_7296/g.32352 Transcript_7296/m.32352 type:complete len:119 (+) Transcript_7296:276-632(+)